MNPQSHPEHEPKPLPIEGEAVELHDRPEVESGLDPPMAYIASLSDYNNGILHGRWIDMAEDIDEVYVQVAEMLDESPSREQAEEYAIHDHQGFGGWQPSEYEPLDTVHAVAEAIAEHGEAVAAWIDYLGDDPLEAIASFADAYEGTWPSADAYAQHLLDDYGLTITVEPLSWQGYVNFDVAAFARDLSIEMYIHENTDGSVSVFNPYAI